MKPKNAVIFMDYNETFDDVELGKGFVLFHALHGFIQHFGGNVKIVIVTASPKTEDEKDSIKSDLRLALSHFPANLRACFSHLIENSCHSCSEIVEMEDDWLFTNTISLSQEFGSKMLGVEKWLEHFDPDQKVSTCVFVGDDPVMDGEMLWAEVGNRQKFMVLAKKGKSILKDGKYAKDLFPMESGKQCEYTAVRLSMEGRSGDQPFAQGQQIFKEHGAGSPLLIQSGNNSYGVGRGLNAVTGFLQAQEKDRSL